MPSLRSSLAVAFTALAASCATSTPRPATVTGAVGDTPTYEGRAVYPTAFTDQRLATIWSEAQRQLADRVPSSAGLTSARFRELLTPWARRRADGVTRLDALARALPGERPAQDTLFVSIVMALVLDDVRGQLTDLAPPETLRGNADAERAWRDALADVSSPFARTARDAWRRCARSASSAPETVRSWGATCAERADALESAVASATPAHRVTSGSVSIPAECEGGEYASRAPDPEAPAPDETRGREIAVVYEGTLFEGPEREVLVDAVHGWMSRLPGARLVARDEVRAAEALVAQRRWRADGPVCGQAPPVAALLAERHPNLVIAAVETWCGQFVDGSRAGQAPESRAVCTLAVHARRAGTANRGGLPDDVSVDLDAPRGSVARWTEAVARLGAGNSMAAVFGGLGTTSRHAEFRVLGYADDDPWLRIGTTLYGVGERGDARDALLGCATRGGGVGSYRIAWTISPTGEGGAVQVESITGPTDGSAAQVATCLTERLARVRWPCTRSGDPARVEARLCIGWR